MCRCVSASVCTMADEHVLHAFASATMMTSSGDADIRAARAVLCCTCRALRRSVCFIGEEVSVRVLEMFLDMARDSAVSRREAVVLSAGEGADAPTLAACYDVHGRYFHIMFGGVSGSGMVVHDSEPGSGAVRSQLLACMYPRSTSGSTVRSRRIGALVRAGAVHGGFVVERMCAVALGMMRCRDVPLSRASCVYHSTGGCQRIGLNDVLLSTGDGPAAKLNSNNS